MIFEQKGFSSSNRAPRYQPHLKPGTTYILIKIVADHSLMTDMFRFHLYEDFEAKSNNVDVVGHMKLTNVQSLIDYPVLDKVGIKTVYWFIYNLTSMLFAVYVTSFFL